MTEIPEHLIKRAAAAKAKAAAKKDAGSDTAVASATDEKIPRDLLEKSQQPGGVPGIVQPTGPDGHTQRLLTVVKSGSIQDMKPKPMDKVHVWPHLLLTEFVAALVMTAFLLFFSMFVNAPLLEYANFNETPNPSKAPWYFLGLQELLTMFHPMIAGVTVPGAALAVLVLGPYIDKNPSNKPEDRKFAISLMTIHLMFWAVLTIIGSFFRSQGFLFTFPWETGLTGIFHL
jgi:quinol---cytochrome c reductase cytochrome c subunit, bacillus type